MKFLTESSNFLLFWCILYLTTSEISSSSENISNTTRVSRLRSVSYDYGFLEKHQFGEESIHSFTLTHQRAIFLLNFALDILYFRWGEFLNINYSNIYIKLSKSKYLSASLTVQKQSFADFFKTSVLKNFIIFTEKHLCRSVFSGF